MTFSGHQVLKSYEGLVFNLVNKYANNYKDEKVLKKPSKLKKINEKSMTTMLRLIILWELGDMREMGSSLKDREINTSADCNTRIMTLMMMNCYCEMLDQWKCQAHFQADQLSKALTITNLRHSANRCWASAEPVFRLC